MPAENAKVYPHYFKDVRHLEKLDVYTVIELWKLNSAPLQHALKKLLCCGQRGAKDQTKDIEEVIACCKRFLEMQIQNDPCAFQEWMRPTTIGINDDVVFTGERLDRLTALVEFKDGKVVHVSTSRTQA